VQAHARIGYWTRELATDRLELSDSLHEILGVPRDQWEGNFAAFFNRVHPEDRPTVGRAIQSAYEGSGAYDIRFRVQRPDGGERSLDAMGRVEFDAAGRPLRVWGTALDITNHVRAQQAVEHGRAQLAGIVGSAMDAIITVDAAQRIVQFNAAAEQMFGVAADRAIGTRLDRFIPLDARSEHAAHIERFAATGVSKRAMGRLGQVRGVRLDGREFPAEASISQLVVGEAHYFTVIMRDITERARTEQQLRQNAADLQRLSLRIIQVQEAERRHIARELHDEIGQTLTAAKLSVQQQGDGPALAGTVAALDHVLQQVRTLSLDLRPSMLDDLGLPATLRWLLGQQSQLGKFTTALELEGLDERLASDVETTAFRIVQEALTNVLRHAAAQRVIVRLTRRDDRLLLEVQDDGLGFDPRARSQSFGLQGMRERATLVGGELEIDSAAGRGTTVRARLPCRMPDTEVRTP
jgi:PAS domain S-box-containing protein